MLFGLVPLVDLYLYYKVSSDASLSSEWTTVSNLALGGGAFKLVSILAHFFLAAIPKRFKVVVGLSFVHELGELYLVSTA